MNILFDFIFPYYKVILFTTIVVGILAYRYLLCPLCPSNIEAEWHDSQVILQWTDSYRADTYDVFYRVKSLKIKEWTLLYVIDINKAVINITNGHIYEFYVIAKNEYGTSLKSSTIIGSSRAPAPTNVTVSYKMVSACIVVQWSSVNNSRGYIIKRSTTKLNDTFHVINTINSPLITEIEDNYFQFGVKYRYVVVSIDDAGESQSSNEQIIDLRAPAPETVTVTLQTNNNNNVLISWTTVRHLTGYIIRRATESSTSSFTTIKTLHDPQATSFIDSSFQFGVKYSYVVVSVDETGESEQTSPILIIPRAPMPNNFTAKFDLTEHIIKLQWTPISNCNGYIIKRKINLSSDSYSVIGQITDSSIGHMDDTDIILGTKYEYTITSIDQIGSSVSTQPLILECPRASTLTGLTALFNKCNNCIVVQWAPILRCNGYVLKRSINTPSAGFLGGMWNVFGAAPNNQLTTIATFDDPTITRFNDNTFIYGVRYNYIISAVDAIGESKSTSISDICFRAPIPEYFRASYPVKEVKSVTLQWTPVKNSKGYIIRRAISSLTTSYNEIKRISDPTIEQTEDTTFNFDTLYYYTIASIDEIGESKQTHPVGVVCPWILVPTDLTAAYNDDNQSIKLQWKPVVNAKGYIIKRVENSINEKYNIIETVNDRIITCFEDKTFQYAINNYYTITTIDKYGESNPSTAINIYVRVPAPKNISASLKSENNKNFISIKWDPILSATGYVIKRAIKPSIHSFSIIGTLDSSSNIMFNDEMILYGATYIYNIYSCDIAGESILSNNVQITCPRSSPPSRVEIKPSDANDAIIVNWSIITNCLGYKIYRSTSIINNNNNLSKFLLATINDCTVGSYIDSTIQNGIQYHYTIASIDSIGVSLCSITTSGRTMISASTDLCAKILYDQNAISLSWTGVEIAIGYRIQRKNKNGQIKTFQQTGSELNNKFLDKQIVARDTPYIYTVSAFDNISEGMPSNSVTVRVVSSTIQTGPVTVRFGDLLTEQVDAIVVCSTSNGLMQNILKASGLTITESEKNDSIKLTNECLPCKNIIFHSWKQNYFEMISLEDSIREFMKKTIQRAITAQCKTIAFPAIGCGGYGCDIDTVARAMTSEAFNQLQCDQSKDRQISIIIESNRTDLYGVFLKYIKAKENCTQFLLFPNETIPNWDIKGDKYPLRIELSESSEEYLNILSSFQETMKRSDIRDGIRIERIQNELLYRQYELQRNYLDDKLKEQTEKLLFHGCPNIDTTLTSIMENGFNRSRAGEQTGTVYGHGTYFSTKASESHYYAKPHYQTGERVMFACLVLLGKSTQGNSSMKTCPQGYHSTTDGTSIYVVYHDAQAYPNYLIHYRA